MHLSYTHFIKIFHLEIPCTLKIVRFLNLYIVSLTKSGSEFCCLDTNPRVRHYEDILLYCTFSALFGAERMMRVESKYCNDRLAAREVTGVQRLGESPARETVNFTNSSPEFVSWQL